MKINIKIDIREKLGKYIRISLISKYKHISISILDIKIVYQSCLYHTKIFYQNRNTGNEFIGYP